MIQFRTIILLVVLVFHSSDQNENSCDTIGPKCLSIAALIPARAGSKGIKNKNLSILGNETLLSRTLRVVHDFGQFDTLWVLTDGDAIAKEGINQGAKIHWRDPQTATDNASTVSAVYDFLKKQKGYDVVAVLQCTSPFLKKEYLRKALSIILTKDVDCVFSVVRNYHLRWNDHNGHFAIPMNFNPKKRPRRQDWEGELSENGMFYFVKSKLVLQNKVLQNERCKTIEIPKQFSLEIDTEIDLLLAKAMLPVLEKYSEIR